MTAGLSLHAFNDNNAWSRKQCCARRLCYSTSCYIAIEMLTVGRRHIVHHCFDHHGTSMDDATSRFQCISQIHVVSSSSGSRLQVYQHETDAILEHDQTVNIHTNYEIVSGLFLCYVSRTLLLCPNNTLRCCLLTRPRGHGRHFHTRRCSIYCAESQT